MRTQKQQCVDAIFETHTDDEKNQILHTLWNLAFQSGINEDDIPFAAAKSGLKLTHTPVVIALNKKQPIRNRLFNRFQRKILWLQSGVGLIIVTEQASLCASFTNQLHTVCCASTESFWSLVIGRMGCEGPLNSASFCLIYLPNVNISHFSLHNFPRYATIMIIWSDRQRSLL